MTRLSAPWLDHAPARAVCAMLEHGGHQALFVGGCVRNALLGVPVSDLDICTDARPERVIALAKAAGLKPVPTGIDHGTVTVVADHEPFEITTFRRDVRTDGRRAVVAFADTIEEDARRRDFTMNALYARINGTVTDPLGGLPDLKARHVRFIGTASHRIREDYLRSLRFFRFHAWYGDAAAGMDAEALDAIARNLDGLDGLSRERVGAESVKLLTAPDPAPAVAAMRMTGALARFLPGADDRALAPLVHLEQRFGLDPEAMRRLAALGGEDTVQTLRLSRAQRTRAVLLREAATAGQSAAELGYRHGAGIARDALLLRAALLEQPLSGDELHQAEVGAAADFPVTARDLMQEHSGAALGKQLKRLEQAWIASGFTLTRAALLEMSRTQEG
ncbi:CCA tRNA nucleotidyltransferase [Marinibacterium profundimaris]|uniref:Poly(A) polymerase n=1 Tax=Marinibacterium profundimaris TaxID=1679460 RepID=A0A225NSH0_9RHOB|nr:CCA tRNA nucleotidyltransferase [Marinibacterium profundimaris]OWU75768.1 poly(A) polymerase [Marinibacterium profundimaris]